MCHDLKPLIQDSFISSVYGSQWWYVASDNMNLMNFSFYDMQDEVMNYYSMYKMQWKTPWHCMLLMDPFGKQLEFNVRNPLDDLPSYLYDIISNIKLAWFPQNISFYCVACLWGKTGVFSKLFERTPQDID